MSRETKEDKQKKRTNLAAKVIRAIVLVMLLFGILIGSVGLFSFRQALRKEYSTSTYHMARTAAAMVKGDRLEDYLEGREQEEYARVRNTLYEYCININVSLIYIIVVDQSDYGRFVSVVNPVNNSVDNTSYTEWELGYKRDTTNDEYRQKYKKIYEEGSQYETVYRIVTTDGQHPHITTMVPVKGESGQVKGILCMQRPVREFTDMLMPYIIIITASTIIFGVLASYLAAKYVRRQFITPVEDISSEASRFAKENTLGKPLGELSDIKEISDLAASLDTLENDMVNYMDGLTKATAEREHIKTELSLANTIQTDAIPNVFPAFPDRDDFDIYGSMTPARMVGGDFYNFMLIDDDHIAMWLGDVSGKGIPGALFMMISNLIITERTRQGGSPAEILMDANNYLLERNKAEMFVSVWLGILELSTGKLIAANAGHEYPALMKNHFFELLKDKHGLVLGGMEDAKYTDYELMLEPGDKIFVYSDGVPEASDQDNTMFGTERMLRALNAAKKGSPEEVLRSVKDSVDSFVNGAVQFDDLTMLCLEYKPTGI